MMNWVSSDAVALMSPLRSYGSATRTPRSVIRFARLLGAVTVGLLLYLPESTAGQTINEFDGRVRSMLSRLGDGQDVSREFLELEVLARSNETPPLDASLAMNRLAVVLSRAAQPHLALRAFAAAAARAEKLDAESPTVLASLIGTLTLDDMDEAWTSDPPSVLDRCSAILVERAPNSQAMVVVELLRAQFTPPSSEFPTSYSQVLRQTWKIGDETQARIAPIQKQLEAKHIPVPTQLGTSISGTDFCALLPEGTDGALSADNPRWIVIRDACNPLELYESIRTAQMGTSSWHEFCGSRKSRPIGNFLDQIFEGSMAESLSAFQDKFMKLLADSLTQMQDGSSDETAQVFSSLASALSPSMFLSTLGIAVETPLQRLPATLEHPDSLASLWRSNEEMRLQLIQSRINLRDMKAESRRKLVLAHGSWTRFIAHVTKLIHLRTRLDEVTGGPIDQVRELASACELAYEHAVESSEGMLTAAETGLSEHFEAYGRDSHVIIPLDAAADSLREDDILLCLASTAQSTVVIVVEGHAKGYEGVHYTLVEDHAELQRQIAEIVRQARFGAPRDRLLEAGRQLKVQLFQQPALRRIVDAAARVVVVPSTVMPDLPVTLLVREDGDTFLGQTARIVYVDSYSWWCGSTERPRSRPDARVLVMGDPHIDDASGDAVSPSTLLPLPGARAEALEIATMYATSPLLGGDASESRFREEAPQSRLLHIASHGIELGWTGAPATCAGLWLAADNENSASYDRDGALQAWEVLTEMSLNSDLVVLAGCSSGSPLGGQSSLGELPRAFLACGARCVVATQWDIPDSQSKEFFTEFYKHLKLGAMPDEALRRSVQRFGSDVEWMPASFAAVRVTGASDFSE